MRISDWSSDVCSADLLHRADESGVRRLAQRGLVGGGDLCGRLGGGGNGKRKDANRQDDGADHGSFLSGVCGGSGSIGISAGGSGATNSSGLGKRSSGFRTSVSSSRDQSIASIRSEEHTSELQSLMRISYAVFCLKKKHIRQ